MLDVISESDIIRCEMGKSDIRFVLRMPPELAGKLTEYAKRTERSLNQTICALLEGEYTQTGTGYVRVESGGGTADAGPLKGSAARVVGEPRDETRGATTEAPGSIVGSNPTPTITAVPGAKCFCGSLVFLWKDQNGNMPSRYKCFSVGHFSTIPKEVRK